MYEGPRIQPAKVLRDESTTEVHDGSVPTEDLHVVHEVRKGMIASTVRASTLRKPRSGAVEIFSEQPHAAAHTITVTKQYCFKSASSDYSVIQILGIRAVRPVRIS